MKKYFIVVMLLLAFTGFAMGEGLVIHSGLGYHSSYETQKVEVPSTDLTVYPLGFGGYLGLGYSFGEKKMVSAGAEIAASMFFSLESAIDFEEVAYKARLFLKFKPDDLLSLVVFGGAADASDLTNFDLNTISPVVGGRFELLFAFVEYSVVMSESFTGNIIRNEISIGYTILR